MDTREFSSCPIRPDDVRDGPRTEKIRNVSRHDKFHCLVLGFESGDQLNLNKTTTRALQKAFGYDSDAWIGHTVTLELGYYQDWESDPPAQKETVTLQAVAAGNGGAATPGLPAPPARGAVPGELDDDIPY